MTAIISAFGDVVYADIVSAALFEEAFSGIVQKINSEIDALANSLPAELDPLKDLIAPMVQFKLVIMLHVY